MISLGLFFNRSDRALVFNRAGNYFDTVAGASVEVTGLRLRTSYHREDSWGFDGELYINDAKCTYPVSGVEKTGDAPYIPGIKSMIKGYLVPARKWLLHGTVNIVGSHTVQTGSTDEVDPFLTVDCSVERELMKYLSVYVDVRNITNSDGAWWTNQYRIPGTGLYGGFKVHY